MSDLQIERVSGASPALDILAASGDEEHGFFRAAWFASVGDDTLETLVGRRSGTGEPLFGLPLVRRKPAFPPVKEVPGSYWPYRSVSLSRFVSDAELAGILTHPEARRTLGRAWRLGPIYSDDPTGNRLIDAARASGWTVLSRPLGTCFVLDLARRRAEGAWPSTKTQRKNRWLERRLADHGALEFRSFSGGDWNEAVLDTLASIEAESWVGRRGGDAKFLDPAMRRIWAQAMSDSAIAQSLSCTILYIAGSPAAFVFTLSAGSTLHCIANSYSERFAEQSPGRLLLYREFASAADRGVTKVDWGAGDAGYKSEMGGEPGPQILDHLFVRGRLLAAMLRLLWTRTSG